MVTSDRQSLVAWLLQTDRRREDRQTRLSYLRQRVAECDGEGLALAVAPDVALQTVLAAERLLTAVTGTVKRLLPFRDNRRIEYQPL